MANSDKNILITPNIGQSSNPNIVFTGAGNSSITLEASENSSGELEFIGSGTTFFSISTSTTNLYEVTNNDGVNVFSVYKENIELGAESGTVVINGEGLKLPALETSQLPNSATPGTMIYDISVQMPRYFDGRGWEFVFPPDDFGPGQGFSVDQGADGRARRFYTHQNNTQYTLNTDNQGATNGGTKLQWYSGCPGSSAFAYHSGHQTNWWPMYHAIKVTDDPRGVVLNVIDWQTHSNAIGNVDMWGSNQNITADNYRDERLYTHLGRIHFGGFGGGGTDCTVYTRNFNPNNWGYKWYLIKGVDNSSTAYPYPVIGGQGGWAMYRVALGRDFTPYT